MMSQFGGKVPPPWQTRHQATPIQNSLLGQHPGTGGGLPNHQIILGAPSQGPPYAHVPQSMIQPPGLGGLQTVQQPSIPQPHLAQHIPATSLCSSNIIQPCPSTIAQVTIPQSNLCQQGNVASLMGHPPLSTPSIPPSSLVSHAQLTSPLIQPQITTVTYPTPRTLAPPGSFTSQSASVNIGGAVALATNVNASLPGSGIIGVPPSVSPATTQPPPKQRVFTGTITKLCADFGFVDEDVFFQTSCVKGPAPKVADRVLVEASYNPNMPFKWNANRVQVIPGSTATSGSQTSRNSGQREPPRTMSFNAVPPPSFNNDTQSSSGFTNRSGLVQRARSPRRDRREDLKRITRDRQDREDKEKDTKTKKENRKRSRSRDRSRSPPRRRARIVPRYNVQVPKIILCIKEANVLELRKRYSNLYVPSDVFLACPLWSDTFQAHRPFQIPRPVSFHIMNKEVDPVTENITIYDPPDVNHGYAAKVMLMSVPPLEDIYRRSCSLSEDPNDVRSCFVHPTRLINFLVGLKGKNETMAIGGYWSPSLDGPNPENDPSVLIKTAIRTCKALTSIDLAGCTTWYRFAEIYYRRGESTHKGRYVPARVETTVLFLPDVWNICPTKLEWDGLSVNYKTQLDQKLQATEGGMQTQQLPQQSQEQSDQEDPEEEDGEEKDGIKKDPSHYSHLDPKNMKVVELRSELDARVLNSKGLKSQLIARLTKVLKSEQEKEEQQKSSAEKCSSDEARKKEDENKKKEEEKRKLEEEEKRKEDDERRKAEEKERCMLEKRYTLPEQPMIIVHPSRTAKSGKFDCTTMSLSVMLDYRQEDNKEHSFEVSLFAELFNEMLMRDFAFRIFRALVEAPDKKDERKDVKEKEKDKKEENKEGKREQGEEKDDKEKISEEKDEGKPEKDEGKPEKDEGKPKKDELYEEEEMDDDDDDDDVDDDDSKDGPKEKDIKDKDLKKDANKEKKSKRKRVTANPYLLLSFVYFDQTHTGYIVGKDLEDIISTLGLNLSRAQVKKLVTKVLSRDVLYYRKLTDVTLGESNTEMETASLDLEQLAKGNSCLLPLFCDQSNESAGEKACRKSPRSSKKEEPVITSTGVVKYEGSLVDISKLMQQMERSEKARSDTEEKLKEVQKELGFYKEESKKATEKNTKLNKEIKSSQLALKGTGEDLKKALENNKLYQKVVSHIKTVIQPLLAEVSDEVVLFQPHLAVDKEEMKIKTENSKNGHLE